MNADLFAAGLSPFVPAAAAIRAGKLMLQEAGSPIRAPKRTVRAALEAYLADLKRHGRAEAAEEAEARFKLVVYKDPPTTKTPPTE